MTKRYDSSEKEEIIRLYRILKLDDVIKVMSTRGFKARSVTLLCFDIYVLLYIVHHGTASN
jgi:hypothetical protein